MRISAPKSEVLFCRPRVDTGEITEEAYSEAALKELSVADLKEAAVGAVDAIKQVASSHSTYSHLLLTPSSRLPARCHAPPDAAPLDAPPPLTTRLAWLLPPC